MKWGWWGKRKELLRIVRHGKGDKSPLMLVSERRLQYLTTIERAVAAMLEGLKKGEQKAAAEGKE